MKNVIYYFTGTGNSLAIAKKIAAALGDCEVIPVASLKDTPGKIAPVAERVGIVCPVYFLGLPLMVAEFAGRLDCSRAGYTFAIVTFGGSGSSPTLRQLDAILKKENKRGLDAGFAVKMPGNYILMYDSLPKNVQADLFAVADRQVAEMVPVIRQCEHRDTPLSPLDAIIHAVAYPYFSSSARKKDRGFTVTDACTSCGTCAAICPAGNIEMTGGRPAWKNQCEVCCGCIQLCPEQAIQAGPKTVARLRYHNPDITVAELKTKKE